MHKRMAVIVLCLLSGLNTMIHYGFMNQLMRKQTLTFKEVLNFSIDFYTFFIFFTKTSDLLEKKGLVLFWLKLYYRIILFIMLGFAPVVYVGYENVVKNKEDKEEKVDGRILGIVQIYKW